MKTIVFKNQRVAPSKVVCIGRNYVEHIQELNNEVPSFMVIFMKPNSSVSEDLLVGKTPSQYEAELSFVIKHGKIAGVGFGLDLTKRELQSELKAKGLPWERAKAFDGSAVFSRFVQIDEYVIDLLSLQLYINGVLAQEGCVAQMLYKPQEIISEIGTFSTLLDNDIIMTGTPKGVGVYNKNDIFLGKILSGKKEILACEWIAK